MLVWCDFFKYYNIGYKIFKLEVGIKYIYFLNILIDFCMRKWVLSFEMKLLDFLLILILK